MPNSTNIFDPLPAASASAAYGPFEPSSQVVAGLFEEPTAADDGHLAREDAGFEQRYQAVLAEELESGDFGGRERRRPFALTLPSGGLARQLIVGAICATAAFFVASIAVSLFHGSPPAVKSAPTTTALANLGVSRHPHRQADNPRRTAGRHLRHERHATRRATTRRHVHRHTGLRHVEHHVAQRRVIASTSPAVAAVPAAVEPSPAPQRTFVAPPYTPPPVHVPAPQSPPNTEFGFEQ